jgi:hypothetical protein
MRRGVALALAASLGAALPAQAEVRYRLHPALKLGAGWGSDLFLGADVGSSFEGQLIPSLDLDLSVSPRVKLFGAYECALGLYEGTGGTSVDNDLSLGTRVRLAPGVWGQLSVSGEAQDLSVSQSVDDAVGLEASRTGGAVASPGLRWWVGGFLLELFGHFGYRHLVLETGEPIDDRSAAGVLSAGVGLGPMWVALVLRAVTERSDSPSFSYDGASAMLSIGATPGGIVSLRLAGSLNRTVFVRGRGDWLVRVSFAPSVRVVEGVWVEACYGYAANLSSEPTFDASRHFVYLGVRVEGFWRN